MDTNKESIIKKVQKLLNKAENTNFSEEAMAFMLGAQAILAKHGLSMDDLKSVIGLDSNNVVDINATDYGRVDWWQGQLIMVIASNFRCYCYINTKYVNNRKKKALMLIGKETDVQIAKEVFMYACTQIKYHSEKFVKYDPDIQFRIILKETTREKVLNDYIQGFINGLKAKFAEQVKKNDWGLVLVKDKDVVAYHEKRGLKKGTATRQQYDGDLRAREQGYQQGKKFEQVSGELKGQ